MQKLADQPFVLIGVNGNEFETRRIKKVMEKENLNWRTFVDRGAIAAQWNLSASPTYYIIDHQGVIRNKWLGSPGEKAIDVALEKLIREARRNP